MERIDADVLIVGAGLAGLATALATSERRRVTLLCPTPPPAATASALAQGGIAAAVGAEDGPALHAADTRRAGAGESRLAAVVLLCDYAGVTSIVGALIVAGLAAAAGPLVTTITSGMWIRIDPAVTFAHAVGYIVRFLIAGFAAGIALS